MAHISVQFNSIDNIKKETRNDGYRFSFVFPFTFFIFFLYPILLFLQIYFWLYLYRTAKSNQLIVLSVALYRTLLTTFSSSALPLVGWFPFGPRIATFLGLTGSGTSSWYGLWRFVVVTLLLIVLQGFPLPPYVMWFGLKGTTPFSATRIYSFREFTSTSSKCMT